ncbi:MAG TPA: thioredoxin family protein [Planctomycetaceae bacterium]|jgi:predicted dithiol-disulfide oxidoreductase (DUF899 family)|nr:thioredoxin family protein [Planctomycetaceae bacterium]
MNPTATLDHPVVSQSEWQRACRDFLAKEKELTRLSDEVARQRRELPWTKVDKEYVFDSPQGKKSLWDLFGERCQLATYHFMLGPDSTEGCKGCSYVTDHMDGALEHLGGRDLSLVLVSRASLDRIGAFKRRMGWHLPWVSSGGNDFNHDFAVSFTPEEVASGAKLYNFGTRAPYSEENPGMSFFYKDPSGAIFHTYSIYARGLDALLGTYVILDRAPKGRDEVGLPMSMDWVRHHDKYQPTVQIGGSCCHE